MSWLRTVPVAILSGLAGALTTGAVAAAWADWHRVGSGDGEAVVLVGAAVLLGLVAGVVPGLVVARRLRPGGGFLKASAISCTLIFATGGLAVAALYLLADFPPTLGGRELALDVEIRLPAGWPDPASTKAEAAQFLLGVVSGGTRRSWRHGRLDLAQARVEEGRWIVPAEALLFSSRTPRTIEARLGDLSTGGFILPLPAKPGRENEQWSGWFPQPPPGQPPWPASEASFRFRVRRLPAR